MPTSPGIPDFGLADARAALPRRRPDAHKYDARLLVVAGSQAYLGAALLCSRAAYRGGAGYVQLALPQGLGPSAMSALPEVVVVTLPGGEALEEDALLALRGLAEKAAAVVVGPGLGRRPGTRDLVRALWQELRQPAIFDADALSALDPQLQSGGPRILTPHEGEAAQLLGPEALAAGREAAVRALAQRFHAVALLKGHATLVCGTDGRLSANSADSPALATAGTGDVLAGLVGALLAQGCAPFEAAALGAWLHGRAAQAWAQAHAGRGLLAGDLADLIPSALAEAGA